MANPWVLLLIGLATGVYSGIMGLGGGTIMIPMMVLALGFDQHRAVATSLAAMIPPVTLPAVFRYYQAGSVDLRTAGLIAIGIACGAYAGATIAGKLSDTAMKMIFGFVLVYVGSYTLFNTLGKGQLVRSMVCAGILTAMAAALYFIVRAQSPSGAAVGG